MLPVAGHATASGWSIGAFAGTPVTKVVVNRQNPHQIMAVAGGRLKLSLDDGLLWRDVTPAAVPRVPAFDQVTPGVIYIGTDTGVYVSDSLGASWKLLDASLTPKKICLALQSTPVGLFAAMYDGAGSQVGIFRLESGSAREVASPGPNTTGFDYDPEQKRLYVGTANGVSSSTDGGGSWASLGSGSGRGTTAIAVRGGAVWQASADGLYRFGTGSWNRLALPGELNGTNYGNDMRLSGLALNHGRAFYGAWSFAYPYKFLAVYDGGSARSQIDTRVYDVSSEGDRVWVAAADGLWVNQVEATAGLTVQRPALIIPGILGSMPVPLGWLNLYKSYIPEPLGARYHTDLVLDPIFKTYDPLITSLESAGYQKGKTLFVFPYEWRQDNAVTATQLARKLEDIRKVCSCSKVDIVAHSMGGLVARSYIQSSWYADDVRNLIQVATPNAGAVESYAAYESGDLGGQSDVGGRLKQIVFELEAYHHGYFTLVEYLRDRVPSVGQLLPIFSYIQGRSYPVGYPRNHFLEELNEPAAIARLKQRVSYYVAGSDRQSTLSVIGVGPAQPGSLFWPEGSIVSRTDGKGDGTVLRSSLERVAPAERLLTGDHGGMVAEAGLMSFVQSTLLAGYSDALESPPRQLAPYLMIYVKSPVSLKVTNSDGQKVSQLESTIPDAYYTGTSSSAQFVLIPRPAESYTIVVHGEGSGNYRIGTVVIGADGAELGRHEMAGTAEVGAEDVYKFDVAGQRLETVKIHQSDVGFTSILVTNNDRVAAKNSANPGQKLKALALNEPEQVSGPTAFSYKEPTTNSSGKTEVAHSRAANYLLLVFIGGALLAGWLYFYRRE